jgi:hypothetical protein
MEKQLDEKKKLSLDNYVSDEFSICREERQYALYLYNVLKKYRKKEERTGNVKVKDIFDMCKIPSEATVKDVFYEVTFMRDIFEKDRKIKNEEKRFNENLQEYLELGVKDIKKVIDKNLGHIKTAEIEEHGLVNDDKMTMARYMMNSKPDIAVIYELDETFYLLFLECKFESPEDKRPLGNKKIGQTQIQYNIAKFICNYYGEYKDKENKQLKQLKIPESMQHKHKEENGKRNYKEGESILVNFIRGDEEDTINIKNLIELQDEMFK